MKKITIIPACILVFTVLLCSSAMEIFPPGPGPKPMPFVIPTGWPAPTNDIFKKNKRTYEGFALGKKLFYDGRLSKDGETSCASCHQQFAAFSTFDHDLSHGVNNTLSTRNAPALFNLAWMKNYHWDGSINHIEVQPLSPLTAANEMGESLDSILFKLKQDTTYRRMFKAAFGDPAINSQRMLKALAQFTGSLVSSNSKYDKVMRGEASFTPVEARGYAVYKANCAACHTEPLFTDHDFHNNGLAINRFGDAGRYTSTQVPSDSLKFKVPSLRNVQVTYPYMHDGRFYALSQAIEHYRSGINRNDSRLDPLLKKPLDISAAQKNELIYFLYCLTDTAFTKDPKFAPDKPIAKAR